MTVWIESVISRLVFPIINISTLTWESILFFHLYFYLSFSFSLALSLSLPVVPSRFCLINPKTLIAQWLLHRFNSFMHLGAPCIQFAWFEFITWKVVCLKSVNNSIKSRVFLSRQSCCRFHYSCCCYCDCDCRVHKTHLTFQPPLDM